MHKKQSRFFIGPERGGIKILPPSLLYIFITDKDLGPQVYSSCPSILKYCTIQGCVLKTYSPIAGSESCSPRRLKNL